MVKIQWVRSCLCRRSHRFILTSLLALLVAIGAIATGTSEPAIAQGLLFGNGDSASAEVLPPSSVTRYGVLEAAWVASPISRDNLFQIASPTIINRSDIQTGQLPVEARAKTIEDLMWLEISRYRENALEQLFGWFDPPDPAKASAPRSTQVIISTLESLTVLQLTNPDDARPLTIATVTTTDADFYGRSIENVAELWKDQLEEEIAAAQAIYSPQALRRNMQQAVLTVVGLLVLSGLLFYVRQVLERWRKAIQKKYAAEVESSAVDARTAVDTRPAADNRTAGNGRTAEQRSPKSEPSFAEELRPSQLANLLKRQLSLSRRASFYQFLQWSLLWVTVLSWYGGVYILTTQLPILMQWRERVLTGPLVLLTIWFSTSVAIRIAKSLIQRSVNAWKERPLILFGDVRRQVLRSQTIAGALQGLATSVLIGLGILLSLIQLGLPVSTLLAGSALIGVAISLGAQNLIKDVVNGCLILIEDQFAVGDVISIDGEAGEVETLNLRLTQLRNVQGELISIPNSSISQVKNLTSSWARVHLPIEIAYSSDVDGAIALVEKVALSLSEEDPWHASVLDQPEVLGIDGFGQNSITLLLQIRTAPLQQWAIARELRRRLKHAFDEAGIARPIPQQLVQFSDSLTIASSDLDQSNQAQAKQNADSHST